MDISVYLESYKLCKETLSMKKMLILFIFLITKPIRSVLTKECNRNKNPIYFSIQKLVSVMML